MRRLQRLQAGGVKVLEFPDSCLGRDVRGLGAGVCRVHAGEEMFDKIHADYTQSMKDSSGWLTKSIGAYRAQRDRVLGT